MDVLLDLVGAVEAGQYLAVANVPPRKNTLEGLTAPRALRLQAKQQQLQACRPAHACVMCVATADTCRMRSCHAV